jgi:formylglycine-generating enzyme required for sulfatase activity
MQSIAVGSLLVELIAIPTGEFMMGSDNESFSETPAHRVVIPDGLLLGKYPITQAQWLHVMGYNPSVFSGALDRPVDSVSWDQAAEFCCQLAKKLDRSVRLPSEAEWEYACRAGTPEDFFFDSWGPFVDDTEVPSAARQALSEHAWFDLNSQGSTQSVGLKQPNPWGLHDMIGNVWEWCEDVWHSSYAGAPSDGTPWTEDQNRQPRRCLRGGAWDMNAFRCRSSYRSWDHRNLATNRFGFRIVVGT